MSSKPLDNLVRSGLLKAEPPNQKEFDNLLVLGRRRLSDARVAALSAEGQFTSAYDAAHSLSLAALRWHGYRPDKRYAVFQALEHTLGLKPEIWRVLDNCHRKRNHTEYEGYFDVDSQLLKDLLAATEIVRNTVEKLGPVKTSDAKEK